MSEEMMDIVDDDDQVLFQLSRKEAYARNLRKRIAYVFVIDPADLRVSLAVRGKNIPWRPLHYLPTVGGHIMAGETGDMAAKREMLEEIQLDLPLYFLEKKILDDPTNDQKFMDYLYVAFAGEQEMRFNPDELDRIEFMTLENAKSMTANPDTLMHPSLDRHLAILEAHWDRVLKILSN